MAKVVIRRRRRSAEEIAEEQEMVAATAPLSGMAIACLLSSFLGWLLGIPLLLSVIFGMMALSDIRHHGGRLRGRGLVFFGFAIDVAVLAGLFVIFGMPVLRGYDEKVYRVHCQDNLRQIGADLQRYLDRQSAKTFPDDLGALVEDRVIAASAFACPGNRQSGVPASADDVRDGKTGYVYCGKGLRRNLKQAGRIVLLYDREGNHTGWFNVLMADGIVYGVEAESIDAACVKYRWILPGSTAMPEALPSTTTNRPEKRFPEHFCALMLPSSD